MSDTDERTRSIRVRMTDQEWRALHAEAVYEGRTVQDFATDLLRTALLCRAETKR